MRFPGSHGVVPPPPVFSTQASNKSSNLARSFRVGQKSFGSGLTRQINIGEGRRQGKNLNGTTERTIKSNLRTKVKNIPRKSPRNKSSRKHLSVTIPSKAPHKSKLAPGKKHKVSKTISTPKRQQADLALRRKASVM